ncbi:MAG: hypothetical protein ACRD1T_25465, partial [Acidimicrobiia bacterium]
MVGLLKVAIEFPNQLMGTFLKEGHMKKYWMVGLVVLLAAAGAFEGVVLLRLQSRIEKLEEPQSLETATSSAARPDRAAGVDEDGGESVAETTSAPTPIPVAGITPPTAYVEAATEKVESALAAMAREQQAYRNLKGEFLGDPSELSRRAHVSPKVEIIQILFDPTAFCIEAAHLEVKGAHRRFLSTTGQIDFGSCNTTLSVAQQVPQPHPPEGHWTVSGVRLIDISEEGAGYRVYKLRYEATWSGTGEPPQQACTWTLFDKTGGVAKSGEYGFRSYESSFIDRLHIPLYEWDSERPALRADYT